MPMHGAQRIVVIIVLPSVEHAGFSHDLPLLCFVYGRKQGDQGGELLAYICWLEATIYA